MLPSDLEYEDSDDTNAQDGFLEIATLLDTSCVGVEIPETVISFPEQKILLPGGRIIHPPLLPSNVATVVSSVSMVSRVSLRVVSIAVERIFDSLKLSAAASLGISRRALVTAVSSARTLHQMTMGKTDDSRETLPFYSVLDYYTNTGIYAIHASFSLAELLCLSSFHLYSATIRFSLEMAEESVHIFDGLFGETDTSKALAAFICIFIQEWQGQDDALGLTKRFGKFYALGQITKAVTAYCCLQYINRKRWRSLIKLHSIFEGKIPKKSGTYDPSAQVATKDMFKSSDPFNTPELILRKSSVEAFTTRRSFPSSPIHQSKSCDNLAPSTTQRRKRFSSGPETKPDFFISTPNENIKELPSVYHKSRSSATYKIERGARYVQFAVGAYGPNFLKLMGIEKPRQNRFHAVDEHHNYYSLANHTDVPVENIINSSYDAVATLHAPKLIAPVHYVVIDPHTSSVVVSLRGTMGLSDIVTDLTASYDHFTYSENVDGYVHSGIFHSAKVLSQSPIRDIVAEALIKNPTYSLVLTGHSLGGGCAALLTLLWSKNITLPDGSSEFYTDSTKGFPLRKIHSYIFACPAILSAELSHYFKDLITTYIYRNDVVPCLSLGLIRDFRNITVSFCNEEGMAESVIAKVLGVFKEQIPESQRDELWYWALMKTLRADMKAQKLYPPGRVYWINANPHGYANNDSESKMNSETTQLSIAEVDDVEIAFSEVVFSTSMFTDQ